MLLGIFYLMALGCQSSNVDSNDGSGKDIVHNPDALSDRSSTVLFAD